MDVIGLSSVRGRTRMYGRDMIALPPGSPAASVSRLAVIMMVTLAASSAVAEPGIGDPIAGARVGYHDTTVLDQTAWSPLLEVEGGAFADRRVALTLFGRYGRQGKADSGSSTCTLEGSGQKVFCSWASSTTQTDLALGVRMRVFVIPHPLSIGGAPGPLPSSFVSTSEGHNITPGAGGSSTNHRQVPPPNIGYPNSARPFAVRVVAPG